MGKVLASASLARHGMLLLVVTVPVYKVGFPSSYCSNTSN
jgi:hypothetical protein